MGAITRILTIEDDPTVRSGIVAYLEDSGFQVLEADDGLVGLELFRREHPDAVLCDLRLPGMDGLDVLSAITAESRETPVIIVSGVSMVGDAVQALKRGAWDFVTKPIQDMGMLESAVQRGLERAELMRQNREYRAHLETLNESLGRALEQFKADQEAGRKIQFQLLPEDNRTFGEYLFTRRLFPSMYLSGDFVDYFPLDARYVGFYMADVSGHGAASAFVTVMLNTLVGQYREAYRQDGDETIRHPDRTLQRLDRDLRRQHVDKHLTMFYGVIDREENSMICSSGAQFPYPVLHDGHEIQSLVCPGCPVALIDDSCFHSQRILLPDEFVLLLISDGILDLLPQGSLREKHEVLRGRVTSTHVTIQSLSSGFGLTEDRKLPDDVALLMVSRHTHHA